MEAGRGHPVSLVMIATKDRQLSPFADCGPDPAGGLDRFRGAGNADRIVDPILVGILLSDSQ